MTTPNTDALHLLLEQEESARDAIAVHVRQAQGHLQRLQTQLSQFNQHRDEYRSRWQQQFRQAGGIEIVQCYRGFMERLDQAISQLDSQRKQAETTLQRQSQRLVEAETRVAAIKKLIQRRLQIQQRAQVRQEQKLTDEAAQRSAWQEFAATASPVSH